MMDRPALPPGSWHQTTTTRLEGVPLARQTALQKLLLRITRRQADSGEDLNVFTVFARLGGIFLPYLLFLSQLLMKGRISRVENERIILRVAWRVGCVYEWGHHVHMATALGASATEINSLAQPQSASWDRRLQTLVRAADELIDRRSLTDESWDRLREQLSEDQAVEFCMLVGHYVMVAGTINALGVRLEPGYLDDTAQAPRACATRKSGSHVRGRRRTFISVAPAETASEEPRTNKQPRM